MGLMAIVGESKFPAFPVMGRLIRAVIYLGEI
jgi:hypothetical protein